VSVQRLGEGVAGAIESGAGGAALGVEAGRVRLGRVPKSLDDLREDGCGARVVEIDAILAGPPCPAGSLRVKRVVKTLAVRSRQVSRGCGRAGAEDP
jgi:hypothetical protein